MVWCVAGRLAYVSQATSKVFVDASYGMSHTIISTTNHNMRIFGVIPFTKLQNDT